MNGIFLRKKNTPVLILLLLVGLFCIGFSIYAQAPLTFFIMGVLICLAAVPLMTLNSGAYFKIDEHSIKAKYHWFGKIDCKTSDVDFALPQINTLTIQLKNGKRHTIMGLANSWELCSFIRQNTIFEATEQPAKLIDTLNRLKKVQTKRLVYFGLCMALMFVNVFVTVFLTGERELHEFTQSDWTVFTVMAVTEVATIIILFFLALKTGKNRLPMEKLRYTIKRTVIETHPLAPGFHVAVYTDEHYDARITVFGYPHRNDVYFSLDRLDERFNLIHAYTSDTYENIEELLKMFDQWIDISLIVLQK